MSTMWSTAAAVVSTLVGIAGLLILLRTAREAALRRAEVLAWANEVIRELESLLIVCVHQEPQLDAATAKAKLTEIMFNSSILVERGRLFFRNQIKDDHGKEKEPAYRGYRPQILDPIVVAHQIACGWGEADKDTRLRMRFIAEECLRKFVSLAQQEVGRSKTVSADTGRGGTGPHLRDLLEKVNTEKAAELRHTHW